MIRTAAEAVPLRQRDDFLYLIGCSETGLKGRWFFMALLAVAIVALAGCATGPLSEPCGGFFLCTADSGEAARL